MLSRKRKYETGPGTQNRCGFGPGVLPEASRGRPCVQRAPPVGAVPSDQVCPGGRLSGKQDLLWEAGRLAVCPPLGGQDLRREREAGSWAGRSVHQVHRGRPAPPRGLPFRSPQPAARSPGAGTGLLPLSGPGLGRGPLRPGQGLSTTLPHSPAPDCF